MDIDKSDFMAFVKHVWPEFIEGDHHKQVADKFNEIAQGKVKRVIINMAPRHTKSEFASYLLPAWMVGRNPKLKIIQSTNTTELSVRFGRKAKALMDTPEYKEIFQTCLTKDIKSFLMSACFFLSFHLAIYKANCLFTSGGNFSNFFNLSISISAFEKKFYNIFSYVFLKEKVI